MPLNAFGKGVGNAFVKGLNARLDQLAEPDPDPITLEHRPYDPIQVAIHGVLVNRWSNPSPGGKIFQTLQLERQVICLSGLDQLANMTVVNPGIPGGGSTNNDRIWGIKLFDPDTYVGVELDDSIFSHSGWTQLLLWPYQDTVILAPIDPAWFIFGQSRNNPVPEQVGDDFYMGSVIFGNNTLFGFGPVPIGINLSETVPQSIKDLNDTGDGFAFGLHSKVFVGSFYEFDGTSHIKTPPRGIALYRGNNIIYEAEIPSLDENANDWTPFPDPAPGFTSLYQRWEVYIYFTVQTNPPFPQ